MPGPFWYIVNGVLTFTGTMGVTTGQFSNGSAAAPSLTFASQTNTGMYKAGTSQIAFSTAGNPTVGITNAKGLVVASGFVFGFTSGDVTVSPDVVLARDNANLLAQVNGTSAQAFRIYNTFTSATDYERLEIGAAVAGQAANTFGLIPTVGSSGTLRNLIIGSSIGTTILNSSRVSLIGQIDFPGAASTFAGTATITNGPRAANPVNWVKVKYNSGASSGRMPIW